MARIDLDIIPGDFSDERVIALLKTHHAVAFANTAPGSAHALDLAGLQSADIAFWTAWVCEELVGCAALKRLSRDHGEVKSMHTVEARRGTGIGSGILRFVIAKARDDGMVRLNLQTSSWPFFMPAVALYRSYGFVECPPFAAYVEDRHSIYLALEL